MLPSGKSLRNWVGHDLTVVHGAWLTVGAAICLSLVGLAGVDVATNSTGEVLSGFAIKHVIFLAIGSIAAVAVALPHYKFVRMFSWPLMWIMLGLLVFLLIPIVPSWLVTPRNGARGWIDMGPVDLQPAELAKVAFVLVIADYLRFRRSHRSLGGLIPPAIITFVPVALIILQPDLGTASLFIPGLFAMLLVAGAKMRHLVTVVLIAAMAGPAAYPLLKPHQQRRIVGMINMMRGSDEGADDINFQSFTAMTVAGAGEVSGMDDAESRAVLRFSGLPEHHNDMVFSVIVNRFGLLGGLGLIGLYATWFLGAFITAAWSRDPFGRLLVVGFIGILSAQVTINIGMNLGLLPIVGLTLPFVSYGGSSMLTSWIMTGLIFSVATRRPPRLARPSFEFGNEDG